MKRIEPCLKTEDAKFNSVMIVEESTVMPAEGDIYLADFDIDKLDGAESPSSLNNLDTKTVNQDYLDCFGFDKLDETVIDTGSEAGNNRSSLEDNLIVDSPGGIENDKYEKNDTVKTEPIEVDLETSQAVDNIPKANNKKIVLVYRVDLNKSIISSETIPKGNCDSKTNTVNDTEVAIKEEVDVPVCGKCLFLK